MNVIPPDSDSSARYDSDGVARLGASEVDIAAVQYSKTHQPLARSAREHSNPHSL